MLRAKTSPSPLETGGPKSIYLAGASKGATGEAGTRNHGDAFIHGPLAPRRRNLVPPPPPLALHRGPPPGGSTGYPTERQAPTESRSTGSVTEGARPHPKRFSIFYVRPSSEGRKSEEALHFEALGGRTATARRGVPIIRPPTTPSFGILSTSRGRMAKKFQGVPHASRTMFHPGVGRAPPLLSNGASPRRRGGSVLGMHRDGTGMIPACFRLPAETRRPMNPTQRPASTTIASPSPRPGSGVSPRAPHLVCTFPKGPSGGRDSNEPDSHTLFSARWSRPPT